MKKVATSHLFAERVVALIFAGLIVVSIFGFRQSMVAESLSRGGRIPIVFFGIDAADESRHTDTLIMGVFDPMLNLMRAVFIPRDTMVHLPGYRFRRVNEIYGYHRRTKKNFHQAAQEVLRGVEYVLGTTDDSFRISNFIQVDFQGFRRMVDLLGGVWIRIKIPMHYDDNAGNYHFHREPGLYHMDGKEALNFVRFRGKTGDRGRILRQQEFVRSLMKRFVHPLNILQSPKMAGAILGAVHTNLSFWDVVYLIHSARRLRSSRLDFYILPGRPRGVYFDVNRAQANRLASMLLEGTSYEDESVESIVPLEEVVTVKVWNASGQKNLAYQVTRRLRQVGFDVVDWGNYTIEQVQTRVIDRSGKIAKAQAVSEILGVESCHSEPNPLVLADVEVVLGKNFAGITFEP